MCLTGANESGTLPFKTFNISPVNLSGIYAVCPLACSVKSALKPALKSQAETVPGIHYPLWL